MAAVAGGATMAVELLVPRLVARHVGTSVAVWTTTIAVVLAGFAAGSVFGGRLADRLGARRAQAVLAVAAALAVTAMPWLEGLAAGAFGALPLLARAFAVVTASCALPAFLLGGIGPAASKEAADASPAARGRALGRVAGAGALGSVIGTWLTGWLFVPLLPTSTGVVVAAAAVGIAGALRAAERGPSGAGAVASDSATAREPVAASESSAVAGAAATAIPLRRAVLLAALAGFALLVVEVVALRRVAIEIGAGVVAWTSVLAAILAGASIGAALGGRAADRRGPREALSAWLLAASVLAMLSAWTPVLFSACLGLSSLPYVVRAGLGALLAWGPAAVALGSLPTLVARAAVAPGRREGRRLGLVSAAATLGAVLGATLASPVLLPALGHGGTLAGTSLALAVVAALGRSVAARGWAVGVAAMLALATLPLDAARRAGARFAVREVVEHAWTWETALQHVRVDELDDGVANVRRRRMVLDGMVHGAVDLDDPRWTGYGYEAIYAAATDRAVPTGVAPRALFLGGGPYAFPRRLLAERPGAKITVVEIDPGVTRAAQTTMGLASPPPFEVLHEDARTYVDRAAADPRGPRFDLVYGDTFQSYSVPFQLTTVEFDRTLRSLLAPGGAYVLNVIDEPGGGAFVGAVRATLARVFARVDVLVLGGAPPTDARETFVIVASDRAIDLDGMSGRAEFVGGARAIEVLRGERLARLDRAGRGFVLTDDYAPVENLLLPVAATR